MHIDLNLLFSGLVGLGGVFIGSWITYKLQHRLLDKQLTAAKESQDAFLAVLSEFRNMLNTRFGMLISEIGNAAVKEEVRRDQIRFPSRKG